MSLQKRNNVPFPLIFISLISLITAALGFLGILLDSLDVNGSNDDKESNKQVLMYAVATICVLNEDLASENNTERPTKRQHCNYDYTRAKEAVWKDYLCPYPQFDDKQFQWIFCVSKAIYETIRSTIQLHPCFKKGNGDCC